MWERTREQFRTFKGIGSMNTPQVHLIKSKVWIALFFIISTWKEKFNLVLKIMPKYLNWETIFISKLDKNIDR